MIPDKSLCCHRTNFTLSCRELVVGEKCKRWRMLLGEHPQTKAPMQHWDCVDNHAHTLWLSIGAKLEELTASTDKHHNGAERRHGEGRTENRELIQALSQASFALGASDATLQIEERKQ